MDGRKLIIRSEHSALNALIQSAGSIILKQFLIYLNESLDTTNSKLIGNFHDEVEIECPVSEVELVSKLTLEAIKQTEKKFNFKCPLDGEIKVGLTWADVH